MVMIPVRFVRCPVDGRLLTVDSLNPTGRCAAPCPGVAAPPPRWDPDSDDPFERAMAAIEDVR